MNFLTRYYRIVRSEQSYIERKCIKIMTEIDIKNCKKGYTHGGAFHSDDVFSTAFLMILNPEIKVERGFNVPEDFDGIVYDIGLGEFDHHQKDRRVRENGIPYAAFGLLWERFGALILGDEEAVKFDEDFIQALDNSDNTGAPNDLALVISDYNSTWKNRKENSDEDFFRAVEFAKGILNNRFEQILASKEARDIVTEKMKNCEGQVLILDELMPWKSAVKGSQFIYVLYESSRGGYNIQAVPDSEEPSELVKAFPEEWRGKTEEELKGLTGIEGFRFCHMSGFLCAADTFEAARKVADLALES